MNLSKFFYITVSIIFPLATTPVTALAQTPAPEYRMTVSADLYNTIVQLDSIFFDAYNSCKMNVMDSLLSDNLEFYHDKGGFSNSKKETIDAIQKNICGKVTRELLSGSIEVYEIKDFGAIEIGFHGFHNNLEKEPEKMHFSKFIHIWRLHDNQWQITRVISLH
jgi:hypothetical protein